MAATRAGSALYMHCLPADITLVSCAQGEVEASVFDRYRTALYREAGYKPYIIAAMILLGRVKEPANTLARLLEAAQPRFREL
jgi:ornithine carbamoyltransferase